MGALPRAGEGSTRSFLELGRCRSSMRCIGAPRLPATALEEVEVEGSGWPRRVLLLRLLLLLRRREREGLMAMENASRRIRARARQRWWT